jgi:hypothetical protein
VKTFYCVEDIERLAAQGRTELTLDEDAILTDLARDMARQLGVTLVFRSRSKRVAVVPARPATAAPIGSSVNLGAKPVGCQHGPLDGGESGQGTVSGSSGGVVDQLVDLVKQLSDEHS